MIDKKVYVSPYYIKNRDKLSRLKTKDKLMIDGINKNKDGSFKSYRKAKKPFKITTIINTLFQCNAFKPIKLNDVYDNLTCFEDILEDSSLDYDESLCCKLIK